MTSLTEQIRSLCKQRDATILAHNYTVPEVQDLADFVGDSLELSQRAASLETQVIVFCGVHFMAETAKILNPGRRVLMPDPAAGCPMADMATAAAVRQARAAHPGCAVVSYVNTSAAVKAESDLCCTSANAAEVVATVPLEREILFVPDRNLGSFVQERTGRPLILWEGYCPTHDMVLPQAVKQARQLHPKALVVAHPECPAAVRVLADRVTSTSGMLAYCRSSESGEFIVVTERGLLHRLRQENPTKSFHGIAPQMDCPTMKLTSPEKVRSCLTHLSGEIRVEEQTANRARIAIERMLQIVPRSVR